MKTKKKRKTPGRSLQIVQKYFPKVTEVEDATENVEVLVSQKDCDTAIQNDPADCAAARAAKRTLHADGAMFLTSVSFLIYGNKAVRYHTPESVAREIISFDRNKDFAAGAYHLRPKSPSNRIGAYKGEMTPRSGKTTKLKAVVHRTVRVRSFLDLFRTPTVKAS